MSKHPFLPRARQLAAVMLADALGAGACSYEDLVRAGFTDGTIDAHARQAAAIAGGALRRRGLEPRLDLVP